MINVDLRDVIARRAAQFPKQVPTAPFFFPLSALQPAHDRDTNLHAADEPKSRTPAHSGKPPGNVCNRLSQPHSWKP
jgi:hypothetical protein